MKRPKFTEADLIRNMIPCLRDWGWEIYQEVEGPGGRADIVATQGAIRWAIEAKLSFGLPVIEQGNNWRGWAHYSSVVVPSTAGRSHFAREICRERGIGIMVMQMWEDGTLQESLKPKLNRRPGKLELHEEQKTFCEAGTNQGGHWTPFKRTCRNLVAAVHAKPGMEFKALVKALDHHYSSLSTARSCLLRFVQNGVIPGLRVEVVGGKLLVFPGEAQP